MYMLNHMNLIDGNGNVLEDVVVVVEGTKIQDVRKNNGHVPDGTEVIDMKGYTVLPGMIDAHMHLGGNGEPNRELAMLKELLPTTTLKAYVNAKADLMAGFTTIRSMGDRGFLDISLKKAIESGLVEGPRMKVSGQAISMTGGHGDKWLAPEVSANGYGVIADGPDEVRKAARYQLKMGADFVKLMATGGVMSEGDEPGSPQLTEAEMRAATEEAHKVGKKTAAHAQGTEGIKNAIRAGIDSIEHGIFLDDEAIQMMKEMDAIMAATKWGSQLLGMEKIVGTVEVGKEADLIAVDGDPLEDISVLKDVKFVMKAGKIYKK